MPFHQWRRGLMPKGSREGLPSRTIPGWAPVGNGPGNAFWTPRSSSSAKRAFISAASPVSVSWPAARAFPSISIFPERRTCSAAWRGRSPVRSSASTEALDPLTPDASGWDGLRAWVGRYGDIHARYGPIFQGFPTTFKDDERLTTASARLSDQSVSRIRSKLSTSDLPDRQLDPLIAQLIACLTRTLDDAATLRDVAPGAYQRERIEVAFTDVMHRSLFGRNRFNAHPASPMHPPRVEFGPDVGAMMAKEEAIRTGADTACGTQRARAERS